MPVSFELLHQLKELQLQHGLRNDDFQRYHAHCTGRIRTLRKQLKLSSDYKGKTGANRGRNQKSEPVAFVAPKGVTESNATTANHILLLTLLVERALAEAAEAAAAAAGNIVHQQQATTVRHTKDGGRKRLNKAAVLAEDLHRVATAVGDERLKIQADAYVRDVRARCHLAHERFPEALEALQASRAALMSLRATSTQALWDVAVGRIIETDDRIVFAAQQQGAAAPKLPPIDQSAGLGGDDADGAKFAKVQWLGRDVPVVCLPVKQVLREADALQAEAAAKAFIAGIDRVEATRGVPMASWAAFQLQSVYNKALDALDRTVAGFNDALEAVRHDLRDATAIAGGSGGASQTERTKALRLLQLYLNFNVQSLTVLRTELTTLNYRARFHLALGLLETTGGKQPFRLPDAPPVAELCPELHVAPKGPTNKQIERKQRRELAFGIQHVASPPEIERLCDSTVRVANDALLLPGVEDNEALSGPLEAAKARATAQRDYYSAEGFLLLARNEAAAGQDAAATYRAAAAHLSRALQHCRVTPFPGSDRVETYAEAQLAAIAADAAIGSSTDGQAAYSPSTARALHVGGAKPTAAKGAVDASERATYVADERGTFTPCNGFAPFPPGFRSMPAKPAFVDVAATYLDYPEPGAAAPPPAAAAPVPAAAATAAPAPTTTAATEAPAEEEPKEQKKGGWGISRLWGR